MPFIKCQKIIRDSTGSITSGSASIIDTSYVPGEKYHSSQKVREKLGRVLYLEGKRGIFDSPTRGLVEYDSETDSFSEVDRNDTRIAHAVKFSEPQIHTVFGDSYLLLSFLDRCGLLAVLRKIFAKDEDYERLLAHVLHGILKDGSHVCCEDFLVRSFASNILPDVNPSSLRSDTRHFTNMGSDKVKIDFFVRFVESMRKTNPSFGKGCYVDSTPLPNDIVDNPFNALSCHGVGQSAVMTRLVMVLDRDTGLPVWYELIPGNRLDINTLMEVIENVASTLNIEIDELILDAGYVSKEVIQTFHVGTEKTIIARMPARKGYPYKELYRRVKPFINKGNHSFVRNSHTYFGYREDVEIFQQKMYAYVYVDKENALKGFREYLISHGDEYDRLESAGKDWRMVEDGFFVVLSNIDSTAEELLSEYFTRMEIEKVFKTSKEYLSLLPLSKWTDITIRGKILNDVIDTIALLQLRKELKTSGVSTTRIFGRTQSLMCFRKKDGTIIVETPEKKTKEYYQAMKIKVPTSLDTKKYMKNTILLRM